MKNKYEYSFTNEEKENFTLLLKEKLMNVPQWNMVNIIIVPETSNLLLKDFLFSTNKNIIFLKKNNKQYIVEEIKKQNMMKSEAKKLLLTLDDMKTVKIADIAGNQRKRFQNCLFQPLNINIMDNDIIFLDDSLFSGNTFLAAQQMLKNFNITNIILFNKNV